MPSETNLPPWPDFAEAEIFELHDHGDGEAVVDRGVLDVLVLDAGLIERLLARPAAGRERQVEIAPAHLVLDCFAGADHLDQRPLERLGDLGLGHDECAAAVRDDAAVEPVERIGHHRRVDDFLDGHDLRQHRMRIVLRVMRGRDLDPGELLAGGAVLVHVAHRAHGVHVRGRRAIRELVLEIRLARIAHPRVGAGLDALRARPPGECDQCNIALARCDRFRGVSDVEEIGRATGIRGVDVLEPQAHVIGEGISTEAGRIASRAEITVDVVLGQPGVIDRTLGDLGMELRQRFVRRLSCRVLVGPDNVRFALGAHPVMLSWNSLPCHSLDCA